MRILGTVLVIIGIIYFYYIIMRPPFIFRSKKVKIMIKLMGVKGFWIFFITWATLVLGGGILILVFN